MPKKYVKLSPRDITYFELVKQYEKIANKYKPQVATILEAYRDKSIRNKTTAQHRVNDILSSSNHEEVAISTKTNENIKLTKKINQLEEELKQMYIERNKRREEAAKKFQRFYRGRPAIEITEGERALNGNVREIIATIHKTGKDNPKTIVAKTLIQALRKIPKGHKFKIWAHVERLFDNDTFYHRNTKPFTNDNLDEFVDALDEVFGVQSAGLVSDTGSTITYNVSFLPSGGKHTTSRQREDILNKKSVIRVRNNDNNCFWYALAYLLNPKDKHIRKPERSNYRFRIASELARKCKLNMDMKMTISLPTIGIVEQALDINIYVINLSNIPILGSSINIWDVLIYKSDDRGREKYFLLYDDIAEHFDAITNIKACMACDHFCFKCFKTFTDTTAFDNHECGVCVKAKKRKIRHEKKMVNELDHYLRTGFTKGGAEEITFRIKKRKDRRNCLMKYYIKDV